MRKGDGGILRAANGAVDRPGERQQDGRLLAGCPGRHADLLPILLVEGTVGAALRVLRLSCAGLSGLLRRHSARRGARREGAPPGPVGARNRRFSGAGGRKRATRTQGLRARGRAASPSPGHISRGTGGGGRRSCGRRDLIEDSVDGIAWRSRWRRKWGIERQAPEKTTMS